MYAAAAAEGAAWSDDAADAGSDEDEDDGGDGDVEAENGEEEDDAATSICSSVGPGASAPSACVTDPLAARCPSAATVGAAASSSTAATLLGGAAAACPPRHAAAAPASRAASRARSLDSLNSAASCTRPDCDRAVPRKRRRADGAGAADACADDVVIAGAATRGGTAAGAVHANVDADGDGTHALPPPPLHAPGKRARPAALEAGSAVGSSVDASAPLRRGDHAVIVCALCTRAIAAAAAQHLDCAACGAAFHAVCLADHMLRAQRGSARAAARHLVPSAPAPCPGNGGRGRSSSGRGSARHCECIHTWPALIARLRSRAAREGDGH